MEFSKHLYLNCLNFATTLISICDWKGIGNVSSISSVWWGRENLVCYSAWAAYFHAWTPDFFQLYIQRQGHK
jgi:hypothetical protein